MKNPKNLITPSVWLLICLLFSLLFVPEYQMPTWDLTTQKLNSLAPETLAVLKKIDPLNPVQIEVITLHINNYQKIEALLNRLQKACPSLKITFRNKPLSPAEQHKLGLSTHEALVFRQNNQQRGIDISQNSATPFSEQRVREAISQLQQTAQHWLLFVKGHGERSIFGKTNRDLSIFAAELNSKGIVFSEFDLSQAFEIPRNTHLMILAGSQTDFLPIEQQRVLDYLEKGGHLLWLIDPPTYDSAVTSPANNKPFLASLQPLIKTLGLQLEPNFILDPASHSLGTPSQAITLVNHYTPGTFVESLPSLSVFPWAVPIHYPKAEALGWEVSPFLKTNASTYIQGKPDVKGPLVIGIHLERNRTASQKIQRVIVIGNGHFLSNATLHHYGNRQLIERILDWFEYGSIVHNQADKNSSDTSLAVTQRANWYPLPIVHFMLEYFLTGLLPLCCISFGFYQSHKRSQASNSNFGVS